MKTRQRLALEAGDSVFATKVHPHTGVPLVPIGTRQNGQPIWPILGASKDDDDPDGDDPSGDDPDDDSDDEDTDDDSGSDEEIKDPKVHKLSKENEKHRQRNNRLREENERMQARLKEIEDKDKGDLEKATESVTDLTTKNETLEKTVGEQALRIAFLEDTSFKWKNPKTALRLADLSEVTIDDEGNVEGLNEALKALAKDEPYLLADEDDDSDDGPPRKPSAGEPPKRSKSKGQTDRSNLLKKYPALRRG